MYSVQLRNSLGYHPAWEMGMLGVKGRRLGAFISYHLTFGHWVEVRTSK